MSKVNKILVIGASIAGPAICFWLKKFGYSPVLIEKNPSIRKGGHAIDIRGIAVDVVRRMGIYELICNNRTCLESGCYVDANGQILYEEEGEKFGFRQGDDVEIVRGQLVNILMESIKDVPCFFNQSVANITQHDEYVEVCFKDGTNESFDLVIAADGLHSTTRSMVFNQSEYHLRDLGSFLSFYNVPNYLQLKNSEIMFESNQKLVGIMCLGEKAFAAFMFRSDNKLANARCEQEQKQFLRATYQDMGWEANTLLQYVDSCDDFYFDSTAQIVMNSWTKGRVALLGDAGYCPSPLSGQGTSLALVGAYVLAGELLAADGEFSKAFAHYNALMQPFIEANQQLGLWSSETFLIQEGEVSKEVAETRAEFIIGKIAQASCAINLPNYGSQTLTSIDSSNQ